MPKKRNTNTVLYTRTVYKGSPNIEKFETLDVKPIIIKRQNRGMQNLGTNQRIVSQFDV